MASWATKRKFVYSSVVIVVCIAIIVVPLFHFFYKAPTCFDGVQNGGEQGIDCGGGCTKLCQSAFLPAVVVWTDAHSIAPGLYNLAAYIENPNVNGAAINAPYSFSIFDNQGVLITQVYGTLTIPANRDTIAFMGAVNLGNRAPAKNGVNFAFTSPPLWQKSHDTLQSLVYPDPQYSEDSTGSSLQVAVGNTSLTAYNSITVYTVLKDINNNEVDFSKTYIDTIAGGGQRFAPFTWPYSHNGVVVSEEILPVVPPVLDTN